MVDGSAIAEGKRLVDGPGDEEVALQQLTKAV